MSMIFCLHTVKCQNVSISNNSVSHKCTVEPWIEPHQVLPLQARVDLEAMVMKEYSAFPKAPELLKPDHQIVLCHIQDTCWEVLS